MRLSGEICSRKRSGKSTNVRSVKLGICQVERRGAGGVNILQYPG
ncbi:unnamed protein product [Brassica oleracea]